MLFQAMKTAKDLSGPAIRDALAETKNYPGVTGDITMDKNRNPVKPAVVLKIAKGGHYDFAARIQPEGTPDSGSQQQSSATQQQGSNAPADMGAKQTTGNTAPNAAPGSQPTPTPMPAVGATSPAQDAAATGQPQGVPPGEHPKK